ncbi:hypothetical protein E0E52_07750 [Azotobacter chroococcum]|uniref:O-antigen ligase family protein n=1 Tax=Azotobacter chroococcum TaxID=353 RepID=UPI0010405AFC|nr:O-antigen ligase family protein [Azotobacter chroococcum]TBW09312.1 hypothetical protein E0E52_07750 [Azotobacter chroococcum]
MAVGLIDNSISISYIIGVDYKAWYALAISCKLIISFIAVKKIRATPLYRHSKFLLLLTFFTLLSLLSNDNSSSTWLTSLGFILGLSSTLCLINEGNIKSYLEGFLRGGLLAATIYIYFISQGRIIDTFGRFSYFAETHPNLGSEIFAGTLIATALFSTTKRTIFLASILIYATSFMQGRAAMLSIIAAVVLRIACDILQKGMKRSLEKNIYIISFVLIIPALVFYSVELFSRISEAFLLDDSYRGAGSGFVGRDTRWLNGFYAYLENPFFGCGFDCFDELLNPSAHNFFINGLAILGSFAIYIYAYLLKCTYNTPTELNTLPLLSFLILMTFNDRFMSLNPYPFILYVVLMTLPRKTKTYSPNKAPAIKK